MPRNSSRAGDPVSLLTLMWTPQQSAGRSGVTLAAITAAAVAAADADGLSAVTMRRVALDVGIGAMTVYSYLPGRPELLELMLDAVAADTYAGHPMPVERSGWRAGIEYLARRNWEHHLQHRWMADIPPGRPILGPGVTMKYERELEPLDDIGLSDVAMDHLLTTVLGLVTQSARWQISLERIRAESTLTDEQWWRLSQPVLSAALDPADVPISGRVGETMSSAGEPLASLEFGLQALLDGVAGMLEAGKPG